MNRATRPEVLFLPSLHLPRQTPKLQVSTVKIESGVLESMVHSKLKVLSLPFDLVVAQFDTLCIPKSALDPVHTPYFNDEAPGKEHLDANVVFGAVFNLVDCSSCAQVSKDLDVEFEEGEAPFAPEKALRALTVPTHSGKFPITK